MGVGGNFVVCWVGWWTLRLFEAAGKLGAFVLSFLSTTVVVAEKVVALIEGAPLRRVIIEGELLSELLAFLQLKGGVGRYVCLEVTVFWFFLFGA